eukprot:scaffold5067_cov65-Phaeocystis_antarctica.AAC.1
MGALEFGERRHLPVLGALAVPEGAGVGGESRLLLQGRAVVLLEHGVGLGHAVVHRSAEEEKECWGRRSEHPTGETEQRCMRGSMSGGAAAAARRSTEEVHG